MRLVPAVRMRFKSEFTQEQFPYISAIELVFIVMPRNCSSSRLSIYRSCTKHTASSGGRS